MSTSFPTPRDPARDAEHPLARAFASLWKNRGMDRKTWLCHRTGSHHRTRSAVGVPRRNFIRSLHHPFSGQHSASHPRSVSDAAPQPRCGHQHPLPRLRRTRRSRRSLRHRKNSRLPHSALRCRTQKCRLSTRLHAPIAPTERRGIRTHERPRGNRAHCLQLHCSPKSRSSPPQPYRTLYLAPSRRPCPHPSEAVAPRHQRRLPPVNRLSPPFAISPPFPPAHPRPSATNHIGTSRW
jgi:hypothetical protein